MTMHETSYRELAGLEGAFSSVPFSAQKAADDLQSHVICGFEEALDQGMQPADALALILSWVSSEMVRIQSRQNGCE